MIKVEGLRFYEDATQFINNEKLFLQRYGEQSVRWQLCAPYRCKNKCLLGICFYSDIKHKSNNTTKHAQKVTSVVEFQAQKILAKIIQNNRLLKWTFKALQMVKVWVATVFWVALTHLQIKVRTLNFKWSHFAPPPALLVIFIFFSSIFQTFFSNFSTFLWFSVF